MDEEPAGAFAQAPDLSDQVEGLRRLARYLVVGDDAADEVVQETLLVALRRGQPDDARPLAWLRGVAKNVARNQRRGAGRREAHERRAAESPAVPSPLDAAERLEEHEIVLACVRELPEPYRTTIHLRYFEDLPPSSIAARLGVPVATVKTHLRRGLERLRAALDRRHGDDRRIWQAALAPLAADGRGSRWASPVALACAAAVTLGGALVVRGMLSGPDDARAPEAAGLVSSAAPGGPSGDEAAARTPQLAGAASRPPSASVPPATPADDRFRVGVDLPPVPRPPKVVVRLLRAGGETAAASVDERGDARFPPLVPGTYVAWAEIEGPYTAYQYPFRVESVAPTDVRLRVIDATPLVGHVLDAETRRPIEGALVRVAATDQAPTSPTWRATTDAMGAFRIAGVPSKPARFIEGLQVGAIAPGYALARERLAFIGTSPGGYGAELLLSRGAAAHGRVVDAHAHPVAGAVIHAVADPETLGAAAPRRLRPFNPRYEPLCFARAGTTEISFGEESTFGEAGAAPPPCFTASREDGTFRVDGLRPGVRYALRASRERDHTPWVDVSPGVGNADPEATLAFAGTTNVRIRVTDAEGKPVASPSTRYHAGESPGPGLLVLHDVRAGSQEANVLAPGFGRRLVKFDAVADRELELDVVLEPEVPIRGIVVDQLGNPVPSAYVGYISGFHQGESTALEEEHVDTAADGTFAILGLRAGKYFLYRRDANHRLHQLVVETPGEPVRLVTPTIEAGRLVVDVIVPAGGPTPKEITLGVRARRDLSAARVRDCLRRMLADRWGGFDFLQSRDFESGRFELATEPRDDELVVDAEGFVPQYRPIEKTKDPREEVRLAVGRTVRGRLVRRDGRPIGNGCVGVTTCPFDGRCGKTDADGRFAVERLADGAAVFVAAADRFVSREVPVTVSAEVGEVRIELEDGVRVLGTVHGVERGTAADDAVVRVFTTIPGGSNDVAIEEASASSLGVFRFDLAPGVYRLVATQEGRSRETTLDCTDAKDHDVQIDLGPPQKADGPR